MKDSINDGSDWKTFSVLLKPGQRLKKTRNWLEVGLSRSKKTDTSQDAMRTDSCSLAAWLRLLTKKELLGLLFDFFGRTLHASWKRKSCFVMFPPSLNDWVNERRVQTVCLWGKICMKFLHCFEAGMLFICKLHSLTFLRKSTVLSSIFLHFSNAKQILLH